MRPAYARVIGLGILAFLLWRLDLTDVKEAFVGIDLALLFVAIGLNVPMLLIKSTRWGLLLRVQGMRYKPADLVLAYVGSIFMGLITPGRLGELVKGLHVSHDMGVSIGRALSNVVADRLFDLAALFVVGTAAIAALVLEDDLAGAAFAFVATLAAGVSAVLLAKVAGGPVRMLASRSSVLTERVFRRNGFGRELTDGLHELISPWLAGALVLTVAAYGFLFSQVYILALALDLEVSFLHVSFALALGNIVTLIPVSISGLGTREATLVWYLGTVGVSSEAALSFSLLVFLTFYIVGAALGGVAWLIKPVQLRTAETLGVAYPSRG
jgi:uncharacterized protein (TIRG00374 family)